MEIVIADYDSGYGGRSIMIENTFYPIEKINRNITKIIAHCELGRYAELYTEMLNILDILGVSSNRGSYYTITIVDNSYISRIYYYMSKSRKDAPIKFDVIKPDFSVTYQDLIQEANNGRS